MERQKLNITFHNPNTFEELTELLIRIAAQTAKSQVISRLNKEESDSATEKSSG